MDIKDYKQKVVKIRENVRRIKENGERQFGFRLYLPKLSFPRRLLLCALLRQQDAAVDI